MALLHTSHVTLQGCFRASEKLILCVSSGSRSSIDPLAKRSAGSQLLTATI